MPFQHHRHSQRPVVQLNKVGSVIISQIYIQNGRFYVNSCICLFFLHIYIGFLPAELVLILFNKI